MISDNLQSSEPIDVAIKTDTVFVSKINFNVSFYSVADKFACTDDFQKCR